ncbi:MAG TPA: tripartite tricarboxylate transporter substrate binding protein [Burkholderiales bacterium]|nr:tripartite tricarboxylate transporter substrate binding protein [Burkholderiales bacterium]
MRNLAGLLRAVAAGLALATLAGNASAQAGAGFPTKPVRWVVIFAPGGFGDVLARFVGPQLTEEWAQPVVVENRTGAGGAVGSELVLRAPADGYTLLGGSLSSHAVNLILRKDLPYHPLKDFAPVTTLAKLPNLIVAHPSLPVRDVKQLVAIAKRTKDRLSYGTPGVGTSMHMTGELLKQTTGIDMTHVPYKGGGAVMSEILGGHVPVAIIGLPIAVPLVKAGRLRAVAVTSAKRSPVMPDVPTLGEQGLRGFEATAWQALFVKAGTPAPIVERINRSFVRILNKPENRAHFERDGSELVSSTPQELTAFVESEIARWSKVVRAAGIQPN